MDETWLAGKATQTSSRIRPRPGTLAEAEKQFADREREIIESALEASGGKVAGDDGAAAMLGIPPQTLDSKIASLEINKRRLKGEASHGHRLARRASACVPSYPCPRVSAARPSPSFS